MPASTTCFIKKTPISVSLETLSQFRSRKPSPGGGLTQPSRSEALSRDRKRLNLLSEQAVRLLRVLSGGAMRPGWSAIAIVAAIIAPIIAIGGLPAARFACRG